MLRDIHIALTLALACGVPFARAQIGQEAKSLSGDIFLLNAVAGNGLILESPAKLYRLTSVGELRLASVLADDHSGGVDNILVDYDRRVLAITTPKTQPTNVVALSMDAPLSPFRRSFETEPLYKAGYSSISACIFQKPPRPVQILLQMAPMRGDDRLIAVSVGTVGGTDSLPIGEKVYCRSSGYFGTVWDNPPFAPMNVEPLQKVELRNRSERFGLGITAPPEISPGSVGNMDVRTDRILAFAAHKDRQYVPSGLGSSKYRIFSTASHAWRTLVVPGSSTTVRAFGSWLAFVVQESQPWAVPNGTGNHVHDSANQRASPGQIGRTLNFLAPDLSLEDLFWESARWFPGTLLVYSIDTGRLYRIETGQGDSEVVLIDKADVYYRVNTTLYRAVIGEGETLEGIQLIQDPAIGNVHLAFLSESGR